MSDDDDVKRKQMGSERGFMCGVCEGQFIIQACTVHSVLHGVNLGGAGEMRDAVVRGGEMEGVVRGFGQTVK